MAGKESAFQAAIVRGAFVRGACLDAKLVEDYIHGQTLMSKDAHVRIHADGTLECLNFPEGNVSVTINRNRDNVLATLNGRQFHVPIIRSMQ